MLQALREDCRIDLLTWRRVDLEAANRYFGTDLQWNQLRLIPLPRMLRLLDLLPTPSSLVKSAILLRIARRITDCYDAVVTVNNEADFGRPGIQYIHYPWNYRPRPAIDLRWYHSRALLRWYYGAVERISPFEPAGVRRNVTLVNSDWIGAMVRDLYPGIVTRTLHPPVAGRFAAVPWREREDGFVVVGRISPEKRVDLAIDIVRRLRERGRSLRLHVIGTADKRAAYRKVKALARENREWLTLHENLPRDALCSLLSRQRYGLHAMQEEHFGMAVADMVVAGLIPFVPDGGGQREIVDGVPEVLWRTPEEAIERIEAVLADGERQHRILRALAPRRETLGTDHFVRRVREEVAAFLAGSEVQNGPSGRSRLLSRRIDPLEPAHVTAEARSGFQFEPLPRSERD